MENDCCGISQPLTKERNTWVLGVRSAMHAARQLPGSGLPDVDDAPAPAC